jgi:hypothetical protein
MELSTEVNQCVILQHSGGVEFITQKQSELITQSISQGLKGIVRENGKGYLSFSSIADIMTLEKYYDKFPDKRPEQARNVFEEHYGGTRDYTPIEITAEQHQDQFRGILRGLKSYIDEELARGITPKHAIALYEQKLAKYKLEFAKN